MVTTLFKRKQKRLEYIDLIRLIELSNEFIEIANESYPLDGSELSNTVNKTILESRISQINIYKDCFEKMIEESIKRENPLYYKLKEAYKQFRSK